MAKIELYFGHPQKEKTWDGVEDHAYNQDINIETAVIRGFQAVNSVLSLGLVLTVSCRKLQLVSTNNEVLYFQNS